VERLYVARLDGETQLFIPQRLNQTVDQTVYPVDLKTITLHYETLAGEVMRVVYEEQYKVLSCYGTDAQGEEIKLYSEYLEEIGRASCRERVEMKECAERVQ